MKEIKYKSIVDLDPNSKTVLTHMVGHSGWHKFDVSIERVKEIVYLGKCKYEGDLFAVYYNEPNEFSIWKGIKGNEFNK